MNNDDLDTLDDAKLSEVFAVEVAGYEQRTEGLFWCKEDHCGRILRGSVLHDVRKKMQLPCPDNLMVSFATDANAVLPYLEKYPDIGIDRRKGDGWQCAILSIERTSSVEAEDIIADAWEDTLARAICVALIKAKRKQQA